MRVIREIEVGGEKVLVKEMTLAELRAWLAEAASRLTVDLVDEVFADQDILVSDIPLFSDLKADSLKDLAPSEIEPLVSAIREVNSRFFVIWRRRLAAATALPEAAPISLPAL